MKKDKRNIDLGIEFIEDGRTVGEATVRFENKPMKEADYIHVKNLTNARLIAHLLREIMDGYGVLKSDLSQVTDTVDEWIACLEKKVKTH